MERTRCNFVESLEDTLESDMATIIEKDSGGGGGTAFLSFIVGAVLVAAGILGFFMWDNYKSGGGPAKTEINITAPKVPASK